MFNISNEIICQIISRAKEIEMEDDLFIPGDPDSPNTYDAKELSADEKQDLTTDELKNAIKELEPDQQKELIALMLIGRGDFEKAEWLDALKEANNIPPRQRIEYLVTKPMLADFLAEGLSKFGFTCEE